MIYLWCAAMLFVVYAGCELAYRRGYRKGYEDRQDGKGKRY